MLRSVIKYRLFDWAIDSFFSSIVTRFSKPKKFGNIEYVKVDRITSDETGSPIIAMEVSINGIIYTNSISLETVQDLSSLHKLDKKQVTDMVATMLFSEVSGVSEDEKVYILATIVKRIYEIISGRN